MKVIQKWHEQELKKKKWNLFKKKNHELWYKNIFSLMCFELIFLKKKIIFHFTFISIFFKLTNSNSKILRFYKVNYF